jgi:hypothetical protein
MQHLDQSYRWRNPWFVFRVGLSCFVVPTVVPVVLTLQVQHVSFHDWIEMLLFLPLVALFGSPAMIFLGMPLLCLYLRWGMTGFLPFMIGGGVCSTAVFAAILRGATQPEMLLMDTLCGVVGGMVFRVILFGFDPTMIGKRREGASTRPGLLDAGRAGTGAAILILSASCLAPISHEGWAGVDEEGASLHSWSSQAGSGHA